MTGEEAAPKPGSGPRACYAGEHILKLWERILRLSGDPAIGFRMALAADYRTFGVLGEILPRCATVFEAYRQTARYGALASQGAFISLALYAETISVSLSMPSLTADEVSRTIMLFGLTNLALTPQRLIGAAVPLLKIACTYSMPPKQMRMLKEAFPFSFKEADNRVSFDRCIAELNIPSADAGLKSLLAEVLDRQLKGLGVAQSFEQGMLTVLHTMLNGNIPTLAALCARSGMSRRTLQRRLAESNTTFQRLLRQVLLETSDKLLAQEELSQGEIAFLLGYSDESAFSRAYKSWTGHPPGNSRSWQPDPPL
jgi:AraC-like DNA-binding protein